MASMQWSRIRSHQVFSDPYSLWNIEILTAQLCNSVRPFSFVLVVVLLSTFPAMAQSTPNIERDPEAIALIQHVLQVSGGNAPIQAVRDLIATGTASALMNPNESSESTVTPLTISIREHDQLRLDSTLSAGKKTFFFNRGGLSSAEANGAVTPLGSEDPVSSLSHFFPIANLELALQDSSYSVTTPEPMTDAQTGANLYHFRLRRMPSELIGSVQRTTSSITVDYYVDAATNVIVRVKNLHGDRGAIPRDNANGPYDVYDFSGYALESGLLLPHQIVVSSDRRLISTINISRYQLNTGLVDSDFKPASK